MSVFISVLYLPPQWDLARNVHPMIKDFAHTGGCSLKLCGIEHCRRVIPKYTLT